jgi:glycosyltransferase involved in cell wall biosynthesis
MRILHVIRDLDRGTGGPVNALKGLAEAQVALGHEVSVFATDAGEDKVIPANCTVHLASLRRNGWFWSRQSRPMLAGLVSTCDILHAHMVWDHPIWEAVRQAGRQDRPVILRPCGNLEYWSMSQSRLKKSLYLRLLGSVVRSASLIHFTSEAERAESVAVTAGKSSIVVPLGVWPELLTRVDPSAFVRRFPSLGGKRIVLFLGRLHPKKQPELVIDAFSLIAGDDPRRHLLLAGPSDEAYATTLHERVARLGLSGKVTFTGLLGEEAVREAIAAASVFVLPSQQENFGISVVEAMAGSCPVVISDRVGIAPEIVGAEAGFVCPMDPDRISVPLRRLLDDAVLRRTMGDNGRILVLSRYTWPKVAARLVEAYEALIK